MSPALGGALPSAFVAAEVDSIALLPMLIVLGAAVVGVLVEAFVPRRSRYAVQVGVTLVALVGALLALALAAVNHQGVTAGTRVAPGGPLLGAVVIDGPALFVQGAVLAFALLGARPWPNVSAAPGRMCAPPPRRWGHRRRGPHKRTRRSGPAR